MKTWLTAVYCIVRAILYPDTEIVLAAGIKEQAFEIFEKIKDLKADSPMLDIEIAYISDSITSNPKCIFANGSKIRIVASNDNARSKRCNVLIMDEFRLISKEICDQVLRKFKSSPRFPKYLEKPEYSHLKESNVEILMSSAWLKNHWSYQRYRAYFKQMMSRKSYFVCNISFHIGVKTGIKMKEDILNEMTEDDFDPILWDVEMNGKWLGENQNGLFNADELNSCRKLSKPIFPKDLIETCNGLSNQKDDKFFKVYKEIDEVRIVFADIALMSSNKHNNDASCFGLMRLIPNQHKIDYIREVPYLETSTGVRTEEQALRLRQLFEWFEADFLMLDTMGVGLSVFDLLVGTILTDNKTGVDYDPLGCMNDEEMHSRAMYPNSKKVIYSFKGSADRNSEMAIMLQNAINGRKIRFLIDENTAMSEKLIKLKGYEIYSNNIRAKLKHPYLQTSFAIQEMLNLEYIRTENGRIKVKEGSTSRKDRYSAIAMSNFLASELAREKLKGYETYDEDDDIVYLI